MDGQIADRLPEGWTGGVYIEKDEMDEQKMN